ncbi:hypothetical protein N2152v2_006244 [Parachlorella kessleri]
MRKLSNQLAGALQAVQTDDPADFLQLVHDHVGGKEGYNLDELLQAVTRKDIVAICLGLKHQVEIGAGLLSLEEDAEGDQESQRELGASVLHSAAVLAKLLLSQTKEEVPEALQQAAELLHNHGILAAAGFPALQEEVARLCLDWWQAEAAGRENLTPQTVPYFIMKALTTGTAADVKRCHAMRTALQLFDFEDPSIADVKLLLLRAAFAPSFLRCAEGRRMMAYMFTLQPAFVAELTAIIKNQIPSGRKSVLDAYGEVIYRAWSTCTGACLLHVQQNCIQALMEHAILASTPAMAASLRRVLRGLHCQKHQPGVDKMLLELYEPILFRRLHAANPGVRSNALHVLVDAFPLRDPDESNQDTDKRLADQFAHLTSLLKDVVPEVRAAAVAGVCRVLNEYWELIPGTITAGYMKLMAGELAFDSTSPSVRASVPEGLATLVDNSLAHPLLKMVLPQLEPLLFDSATRVRTAMADLLLALRGIEALPFYDVVPVEKLLDILAQDTAAVSERVQRLLLPTFFPNPEAGAATLAALLRNSPGAGRAFCQFLAGTYQQAGGDVVVTAAGPPVHESQIVGLIKELRTHLHDVPITAAAAAAVVPSITNGGEAGAGKGSKKGRSKRKKAQPAGTEPGNEEEREEEVSESPASWEAILHGVCALVCGLAALVAAGRCEEGIGNNLFLSGTLVRLLERCPTAAARRAVMAMAAAFPALDASAEVRGRCLKQLLAGGYSAAAGGPEQARELQGAVECICAGASRDRLLQVVVTSLGGDPKEVLEGLCHHLETQHTATAAAKPGAEEGEKEEARHGRRAKQGGKKAEAAAKPAGKKKASKKAAKVDEEEEEELGEVDESLACEECGSRTGAGEMLLCDNCDAAFHMGCLDPPLTEVPEGDWFCDDCDARMSSGMGENLALRCLGLLLELEEPRAQLLASGVLARLLPYMELALRDAIEALKEALAGNSSLPEGGTGASTAVVVYLKGCLHLFLNGQSLAKGAGAMPAAGITSASMMSQAAECIQQAVEFAGVLVQHLARLDAAALLQALVSRPGPDAKRSKVSKKKKAAVPAEQLPQAPAVKEALATVQACVALLSEAARVQVLSWAPPGGMPMAHAACAVAQRYVALLGGVAAAAPAADTASRSEAAVTDGLVMAAVANVARLVRNLAMTTKQGRSTTRDLDSVLQQAQHAQQGPQQQPSGSESGQASRLTGSGTGQQGDVAAAEAGGSVEALVGDLLALGCQEHGGALVTAALKPGMASLLAGLCGMAGSCRAEGALSSGWLQPVARLLGRGIDFDQVPAVAAAVEPAAAALDDEQEGDENAGAVANQPADEQGKPAEKAAEGAPQLLGSFVSEHAEHGLVKVLLAAAKSAKIQEPLAGCAAGLARHTFEEGAAVSAMGALELTIMLGFKGVTTRGKSRAGADTYSAAIQHLRVLKAAVNGLPASRLEAGSAQALLHHKLGALFPPAPRVTFGAV